MHLSYNLSFVSDQKKEFPRLTKISRMNQGKGGGGQEQREKPKEATILEPAAAAWGGEGHDDTSSVLLENIPIGMEMLASPDLPFPWRLFIMLEHVKAKGLDNIVSWIDNGTAFKVYKQQEFERTILPHYFIKMTKYNSFTRQLYAYNFSWIRTGESKGGYFNANFSRHKPDNCSLMNRRKDKRNHPQVQQQENNKKLPFNSTFSTAECHLNKAQEEPHATIDSIPSPTTNDSIPFETTMDMLEPRRIEEMLKRPTEDITHESKMASYSNVKSNQE